MEDRSRQVARSTDICRSGTLELTAATATGKRPSDRKYGKSSKLFYLNLQRQILWRVGAAKERLEEEEKAVTAAVGHLVLEFNGTRPLKGFEYILSPKRKQLVGEADVVKKRVKRKADAEDKGREDEGELPPQIRQQWAGILCAR